MNHLPFHEALEDCSRLAGKVPQALCLDQGDYPVIGQGKQEVDGFTNDSGLVFRGDLPVILFGDHTAAFKFVDRPFARGADGTKLFRPRTQLLDAKFAWHFLQTAKLPETGYDRKTKYLENLKIPLPPLEEQRRIAAILDKASTIKQQSAKASALAESLCIARLEQLVATNETLLVARRLEDLCILGAPITYGILQPGPNLDGGIPYVRPSEIKNSRIDIKSLKRTSPEIAAKYRKSELQEGDILFTIVGTIGEAAVVPAELEGANITQSSARIRIDTTQANPAYVYHSLKSQHASRQISRDRLGVAVERLNLHHVRDMEILCLPMEFQNTYAKEVHCMMQLASRHSLTARHVSSLIQSLTSSLLTSGERQ
jgi:type I restriction enzyme S subunit